MGWLGVIVGVFFGLIALVLLANELKLFFYGVKAEGTVKSVSCQWDYVGKYPNERCAAQISFTTKDGRQYPGTIQDAGPNFFSGKKISVLYNSDYPDQFEVENYLLLLWAFELIAIPVIALAMGIFLLKKPKTKIVPSV